jgi:enterochelin esterase-like enzyme
MSSPSQHRPSEPCHRRRWRGPAAAALLAALAICAGLWAYFGLGLLHESSSAPRRSREEAASEPPRAWPLHDTSKLKAGYPPAEVQELTLSSPVIGGYKDAVYVVIPPGYDQHPQERYPVVYLLHGSPGIPVGFMTGLRIQDMDAMLTAERKIKPMIIVMPTGGRSKDSAEQWANGPSPVNQWETFVASNVVDAIDARYRTIDSGSGRAIAGVSEGGYGALNIALHHPSEFSVVESWSGYMVALNLAADFDMRRPLINYNTPMITVRAVAEQLRVDRDYIWFYCGSKDSLYGQNLQFNAELKQLDIHHTFAPPLPLAHSLALWRHYLPEALIVASEHLA